MNWKKWFRRKPKPTHETKAIKIPADKVEELARLDDAMLRTTRTTGASRSETLAYWRFLDAIMDPFMDPYPKGTRWTASVDWSAHTQPRLKLEITIPPPEEPE